MTNNILSHLVSLLFCLSVTFIAENDMIHQVKAFSAISSSKTLPYHIRSYCHSAGLGSQRSITTNPIPSNTATSSTRRHRRAGGILFSSSSEASSQGEASSNDSSNNPPTPPLLKAPTFNGQLILPIQVVLQGLKGHKVAAVYALSPTKGKGYSAVKYISITKDLYSDLQSFVKQQQPKDASDANAEQGPRMAYVRALSFSYPQKAAMQEVAQRWASMVVQEGGSLEPMMMVSSDKMSSGDGSDNNSPDIDNQYYDDDDDDDDDDEFEWDELTNAPSAGDLFVDQTQKSTTVSSSVTSNAQVISPFEQQQQQQQQQDGPSSSKSTTPTANDNLEEKLVFSRESVDKVLDEIRPYLISDGGNVSVHSVDEATKSVYLTLEGACGSCPSSTVTMQMGIERILKEKFEDLGEVAQVNPSSSTGGGADGGVQGRLTMEAVVKEVNRIGPAIRAMGGMVEVLSVDTDLGVVEVRFRGANKVQQGLELALRDVPYVRHVKFVN